MSHKKFIKDVIIIGFSQAIINLSAFFLLPIISKTLGVFDYGIWSQLTVTVTLLTSISLLALSTAFVRFFSSKTDKKEISKGFFSIFFFVVLVSLIILSVIMVFSVPLSSFLFKTTIYSVLIQIVSFQIILNALYTLVLFYFRIYRQMLVYTVLTLLASLGQIAITLFLLLYVGYGVEGVFFSALASYSISLIIGLGIIIRQVGFSPPSFSEMPKYLRFSLPLVSSNIIFWVTSSSDRYIIGFFLGVASVGVYSAAYGIGYLISIFVLPLQLILFPQLSKLHDNRELEEVKTFISYSMKFFLLLVIPSVFGLALLGQQLLIMFSTVDFIGGRTVIPVVALAFLFFGLFSIIQNISILYKKTMHILWIHLYSAIVNLCLNIILIPVIGIIGAALSALVSFILMSILAYYFSRNYLRFNIDFIFILKALLSSILMAVIILLINEQINIFFQLFIGIVIYFICCYLFRIFNKQEMSFFKNILRFS